MPVLEIELASGETVVSARGELSWMSANIAMSQAVRTGGGLRGALKRAVGGGGPTVTRYQAEGGPGLVAFAAKVPGHIVPVDITANHRVLVHRHGWLCGSPGVSATGAFQRSFRGGLWGGEGFVLQRLEGEGRAWVELSGELTQYDLGPGQVMLVHPGHVGMFEERVQFSITTVPGIANKVFGGDGYHLVALTGPGRIWLQSMPLPNLAHALEPYLVRDTAAATAEGVNLGGVAGRLFGD
jgi:uncharacterized protein (TIGR00266 family)